MTSTPRSLNFYFYFLNDQYSSLLSLCSLLHIVHFFSINLHFHLSTLQASLYFFSSVHNLCLIKVLKKEFIANTSKSTTIIPFVQPLSRSVLANFIPQIILTTASAGLCHSLHSYSLVELLLACLSSISSIEFGFQFA